MLCPRDSATNKTDTALALRELKHQQGCQTTKPRNKALKDRARGWGALTAPRSWREARVRPKGRGGGGWILEAPLSLEGVRSSGKVLDKRRAGTV